MDLNAGPGMPEGTLRREDPDSELARQLGGALWSLVCSVGVRLDAALPVSGGTYSGYQPNAFRLQFADGRTLKGRRVDTSRQAEEVEYVSRCLGYRGLPRVLARRGRALLTEWIEGQPLTADRCDRQVLRQCGALQGFAHSQPLPADGAAPPSGTIESCRAGVERGLDALVESALLDERVGSSAAELARAYAPRGCALGFTYVDFCADNIVLKASGDVCVVDNETLSIQPCDYDLGRTWYRWPMPRSDRETYFSGYRDHRQPADFLAHFPFWAIAAVVDGALFRARRGGAAAAAVPVQRLHTLVHDFERGVAAEDAVFLS